MEVTENSINILLVDDDAEYAAAAKSYLKSLNGHRINLTWIEDGETTLSLLKSRDDIHLILMDYYLRSRNGIEILKELREANIEIPVILLTGSRDFRIAVEAMKYGVVDYLVKEETVDAVFPRSILNILERHQLTVQLSNAEKNRLISQKKTEAVQELVVTMCHEFNNPLAAIKISTDILTRQCASPDMKEILTRLNGKILELEKQIVKLRDLNIGKSEAGEP